MPNVSYFFEPLWFLANPDKSLEPSVSQVLATAFLCKRVISFAHVQLQKIRFVGQLLNCRYHGMRKVMNNLKAREFVFKKPKVGAAINLKTLPLLAKNSFISSIEEECSRNSLRVTKLFRLRIAEILPYMKLKE